MSKPSQQTGGGGGAANGHVEPPSMLSSFAGIIETGMLSVFQSAADKRDDSTSRANSLRKAPSGHIVRGGDRGSVKGNDTTVSKPRLSERLSTRLSDSESDMPGLERLERSTCPASSEDEVEDFLDIKRREIKHDGGDGIDAPNMVVVGGSNSCGTAYAKNNTTRAQNKSSASSLRSNASRGARSSSKVGGDAGGQATTTLWARRATCTSSASTLVPGMSPPRTPTSGTESFSGGGGVVTGKGTSRGGMGQKPSGEEGRGGSSSSPLPAGDKGDRGSGRPVGTGLKPVPSMTACSAAASSVGGKTSESRPIPAPLDISVLPDPAPPSRLKHTSSSSSSALSSNPVVLQGAALENLKKLGRPGSGGGSGSGSKGGGMSGVVAYASRRSSSGGGASSCGRDQPGGMRSSKHASNNGGLPIISEPEPPTGASFHITGGVRAKDGVKEAVAVAVQRPKSGSAWQRSESTYAREACRSPLAIGRSVEDEEDSDDAPPPPSPMLTGHLRPDNSQQHQQGRGRGAFKGRGLRPATWTEDDGGQPPPLPAAVQQGAGAAGQAHLRLVLQPQQKGAEAGGQSDSVSPMGTPLSTISVSTAGRGGGGGGGDFKPPLAVPSKEKKLTQNTLAQATADLARRGASARAELVPGLGRSAFEHISVSPTIPLRAISNDDKGIPAAGGGGGDGAGHAGSFDKKLSGDTGKWATDGDNSGAARPHVFGTNKSRSGGLDDSLSVSSGSRSGVFLEAPSLTVAHAPGRIYRPQQHQNGHAVSLAKGTPANTAHVQHGSTRSDRAPPLRLSSSKRLTSFDSRRSSVSPVGWDRRDRRDDAHKSVVARGGSSGADRPKRPAVIDILSTFGSHHSVSREEENSRKTEHVLSSLKSHPEEEPSEGGAGRQRKDYGRRSSSGTRRSSGREDRISQRRSRSSGSSVGGTRQFNSTGSALMGVGSDEARSNRSRGRARSASRSRSGGEIPTEERHDSRRKKDGHHRSSSRGDSRGEFESRRHPQKSRGRTAEASHSRRHSHRSGGSGLADGIQRTGSNEHVLCRSRSGTRGKSEDAERRRHSGHHRRRSSGVHGWMASEAGRSISNREHGRGHRRSGSAPSREGLGFASSGEHGWRTPAREERRETSDCRRTSSGAQRRRGGDSSRRQSGRSSRRGSSKGREARADAQAEGEGEQEEGTGKEKDGDEVEVGRLGVVAVNDVRPAGADRGISPVSGGAGGKLRAPKAPNKNHTAPSSPRTGGRARRAPIVQKKGRTRRTFLGVSAFWRDGGSSRKKRDSAAAGAAATDAVSAEAAGVHSGARPQRVVSRTNSSDLTASERVQPGTGCATPICSGWLLTFFSRRSGSGGRGARWKAKGGSSSGGDESRNSGTRGSGDTTAVPSTVENSVVEDRGGGGSGAVVTGSAGSALSRVSLRKKSFAQERCGNNPGQVSGCYSQFYEPTSPGVIESGGGPAGAEVPEGGARVQHLLRTSQLHSVPRESVMSIRSEDSSSSELGASGKKSRGRGYTSGFVGHSAGPLGHPPSKPV